MTIPKAVSLLRKKTFPDQAGLAADAETTIETVSRWENGRRAPNSDALKRLASIAESKGQPELQAVFESEWKRRIAARKRNLPSAGTQRRVGLEDLKFNAAVARYLDKDLSKTLSRVKRDIPQAEERYPWLTASLQNALFYLGRQLEEIELHIDELYGWDRAEEDKRLLLRQPKTTYGLQVPSAKKGKK